MENSVLKKIYRNSKDVARNNKNIKIRIAINYSLLPITSNLDIGFKVFELDSSNMHLWDGTPVPKEQQEILFDRMNDMIENVKPDRTEIEVVYEIMLKMGLPLTYPIIPIEINNKKMWSIGEDCMLLICLARNITPEEVTEMCDYAPAKIVMADFCFEDTTAMANANYIMQRHNVPLKLL